MEYTLPVEVAYKLEEKNGVSIHLFRLEEDPLDPASFHAALPTFMLFRISEEEFQELSSEYEEKTKEEIEAGIRKAQEETSSLGIETVEFTRVEASRFAGYRVTTKFSFEIEEYKYERISQTNLLRSGQTYWMANGISLTKANHLEQIDKLLNSFTVRETNAEQGGVSN